MDYICYYFQRNKQLFVAVTGGLNQWAEAAEAVDHTTARIIQEVIHIQAVQDHLTDHPVHLTDLQVLLIPDIPEVQEAADTAEAAEVAEAALDALLHFYFCFWS